MQKKLIQWETIAKYKQISESVPDEILDQFIHTSQLTDVMPLLGERLYNDILINTEDHTELLDGGIYTHNDVTYINYGLKAIIALFVNARYVYFSSIVDTPTGHVQRETNYSTPAPETTKKSMWLENRKEAFAFWESVKSYLIRTEYPLFDTNCGCGSESQNSGASGYFSMTLIE